MYIVVVAPECAPAAKAGGLGDVVFGLSRELEIRGNAVEIILPKHVCLRYGDIWELRPCDHDLRVPWHAGAVHCTVFFGYVHGRKCYFIEPHAADNFFGRDMLYGYADDASRFAFFCKAALEFMLQSGKRPTSSTATTGRPASFRSCCMSSTSTRCRTSGSATPSTTSATRD